jgi:hypothetical protein
MATTASRNGNTLLLEASGGASTIDAVTSNRIQVYGVFLTSGATAETLTLRDVSTTTVKLVLKAPATTTSFWDLNNLPITFPNGIRVTLTQTDSFATLLISETKA